jgi:importin subunit alpha-2
VFCLLLNHSKVSVQREAVWALSNITVGTSFQIQAIISSELVPLIILALSSNELKVQREAAWAIRNYTFGADLQQMLYLIRCNVVKPLCDLLEINDPMLIKVLLDGLYNILLVRKKSKLIFYNNLTTNIFSIFFTRSLKKWENLITHVFLLKK